MKKVAVFLMFLFFISCLIPFIAYGKSEIKDINKLIIYIKNQEYDKKNVFLKDSELYTSLDSLKKVLNFNYVYEEEILFINGEEYTGSYYLKGHIIYASMEPLVEFLGYYINYDPSANMMDISGRPVYSSTYQPQTTEQTNNTELLPVGTGGYIVPGEGISNLVKLGSYLTSFNAVWGEPVNILNMATGECDKMYLYNTPYVALATDKNGRIIGILTPSNSYKTAEGITVGATLQQVESIYGLQYMMSQQAVSTGGDITIIYLNGLSFTYDNQSKIVNLIGVHLLQ